MQEKEMFKLYTELKDTPRYEASIIRRFLNEDETKKLNVILDKYDDLDDEEYFADSRDMSILKDFIKDVEKNIMRRMPSNDLFEYVLISYMLMKKNKELEERLSNERIYTDTMKKENKLKDERICRLEKKNEELLKELKNQDDFIKEINEELKNKMCAQI